MRVLALDLGTTTGWAVLSRSGTSGAEVRYHRSGEFSCALHRGDPPGRRWSRFVSLLGEVYRQGGLGVDAVVLEIVHRHVGTQAAHVYGGLLALVEYEFSGGPVPVHYVEVQAVKRAAERRGAERTERTIERKGKRVVTTEIPKASVIRAASALVGRTVGENEADALFVGLAYLDPAPVSGKAPIARRKRRAA